MPSEDFDGEPSFELNMRYNQLIRQRHTLEEQVQKLSLDNDKLMLQLERASSLRLAAERRRFEQVHYLDSCDNRPKADTASLPKKDNTDLSLRIAPDNDSPVLPIEIPDARSVTKLDREVHKLNQEYKRLVNFNHYLSKEYTLLQVREPSQVVVKFYNVTDPCAAKPHFISCSRDTLIDDIVASLPSNWNVSMSSQFAAFDKTQLCVFNQSGSRLKGLPGWISYLEQGGCVFVSERWGDTVPESEKIPSPPLEAGSDSDRQTRRRKRVSSELESDASVITQPRKRKRTTNGVEDGTTIAKKGRQTRKGRLKFKR